MTLPSDADGDVIRRLKDQGSDLTKPYWIDFNIDFANWPASQDALTALSESYPEGKVEIWNDEDMRFITLQLFHIVTYNYVIQVQSKLTSLMAPFEGKCESWGVLI